MDTFQIAGASVPGVDHIMPGKPGWKNNQDAFLWRQSSQHIIGVVCDGCGSSQYSEVGARVGAHVVVDTADLILGNSAISADSSESAEAFCRDLTQKACARLTTIISLLGGDFKDVALDQFLFSTVGFVLTSNALLVFSCGDGVYAINGKIATIGPFPGNAPPYLTYSLLSGKTSFTQQALRPADDVQSVLIGTDGVADLIAVADVDMPGQKDAIGHLSQFWDTEKFFKNPDAIRRRLALVNRERVLDGRIKHGLLHDDTTLVVLRRVFQQGEGICHTTS